MSTKSWMYPPDELTDGQRKIFDMMAPEQNTAPRAALLADRPEVAKIVSQLNDIDAPISDKAADLIEALAAQLAEARKENDTLRGLLGNSAKPCPYCGLAAEDQAKCPSGFPGCARADDQMLSQHFADAYHAEKAEAELAKLKAHAEAMAAGDGTLHGAIDYWQEQAFAMAAGQCCVKSGGLMADDHGNTYCDMQRQGDELRGRLRVMADTMSDALSVIKTIDDGCDPDNESALDSLRAKMAGAIDSVKRADAKAATWPLLHTKRHE